MSNIPVCGERGGIGKYARSPGHKNPTKSERKREDIEFRIPGREDSRLRSGMTFEWKPGRSPIQKKGKSRTKAREYNTLSRGSLKTVTLTAYFRRRTTA